MLLSIVMASVLLVSWFLGVDPDPRHFAVLEVDAYLQD